MNIEKCLELQRTARSRIPGMTQLLSKRPDMFSEGVWPGYYEKAKGVEVWDLDGNKYIDMSIGGIGANILGYADNDVDEAVKRVIDKGTSCSFNCPEEVELAELLCELHPWAEKVRFSRSGGEAMSIAVRIARAHTKREKVAFCGYHGWHDWYLAANLGTENALGEHLMPGLSPVGVPRSLAGTAFPFRYNQLDELKNIAGKHKNDLAVIVMEPIRNIPPHPDFLNGVREIANETGAVLVVDEISAGFRLNTGGAHTIHKLTPDIAVFSKAMGNGYPIAAIIGKGNIMDAAQSTFISSTMWTERIGPTAALATIKKHKRLNVGQHLIDIGRKFQQGLKEIGKKNSLKINVGGMYPCSHFTFEYEEDTKLKAYYIQLMLEKGILASTLFYVMYAHKEEHVDKYLKAANVVFGQIATAIEKKNIDKLLKGSPASVGFKRLT